MWRWFLWIFLLIGIMVLTGLYFAFPPSFYLPHQKPLLILPIEAQYDFLVNIMPMGEKMEHPEGSGHPGIDFGFMGIKENIPYIAAMDGVISRAEIFPNKEKSDSKIQPLSKNMADVVIKNGPYQVVYSELDGDTLPPTIKKGAIIKQGDFVGYGNFMYKGTEAGTKSEMIHWEFGSVSPVIDRFCPLTYFTDESRIRIEKIWADTELPQMKPRFPKICNGDYDGKEEK